MFGWPLPRERAHRNLGASTPAGQLGFWGKGVGGTHPESAAAMGDQIWVWSNNSWQGRYWMMDAHGGAGGATYNGRWWDSHSGTFADFKFSPGEAYYYYHSTNWIGTNFIWKAETP